jgi:hypothetical protein
LLALRWKLSGGLFCRTVFNKWTIKRHLPLLLLLTVFFVLEFACPRFPEIDTEIFFKSAGKNLSQQSRFVALELEGFLHLVPPIEQIYFAQPPLYTWLFCQWTRLTGFGWAACVGYDALISAALAFVVYVLATTVAGAMLRPLSGPWSTALALASAFFALLFRQVARPDELGMVLGFANVWWLFRPRVCSTRSLALISGMLAGLMLCTSIGVFLTFIPFLAALWLRQTADVRELAPSLAAALLGGGLATAICLTPLLLADPHFYRQLFQNAHQNLFSYEISASFSFGWQYWRKNLIIFFATLPVLCLAMLTVWRMAGLRETLALFVAPLVGLVLVFYLRRWAAYWWFIQPWFLLLATVVTADFWRSGRPRLLATALVAWLAIWLAVASVWPAKDYLVRFTLAPEQQLVQNARKLRELIPPGAGVFTANIGWWALGHDRAVYDPGYAEIQDLSRIEYFVTDSNGTGEPGVWRRTDNRRYDAMLRENFEVISDTLPRTPVSVFGLRITNSAYGFGTLVLRRVKSHPR